MAIPLFTFSFGPQMTNDFRYFQVGVYYFCGMVALLPTFILPNTCSRLFPLFSVLKECADLDQRGAGVHPSQLNSWDSRNSTAQTVYIHDISPISPHMFGAVNGTRACEASCLPAAFTKTFGRGKVLAISMIISAKMCTSECHKQVKPLTCLFSG